jgi:predicted Zn-dependent protease
VFHPSRPSGRFLGLRHDRLILWVLGTVSLPLAFWACAVNPVTGKREISLLSEGQEVQMGMQSDQAIVAQYGLIDHRDLATYVENIGQTMVPVSHRPDLEFHFRLLDDPVVNAFALPGGYVYITRGILAYLNSEAALAGVMGHEIGHVTARHGAQRYTEQTLIGVGLGVGAAVNETFAKYAGLAGAAGQLLLLKYGRDDERQSDELGVEYATKVGYDTTDMGRFFQTLDRLTPPDGRLPSWMSTHPDPGERYPRVLELSQQWQARSSGPFSEDRERYLRQIDGIVFGTDPREGFFTDGIFHHPGMHFSFPVPAGWKGQNGKTQVVLISPEQNAGVLFQLAPEATAAASARDFLAQEGIEPLDQENVTLPIGPAIRTLARMPGRDGQMQVALSTWFEFGGEVFVFHGLTTESALNTLRDSLLSSANGFRELTDPAILNTQPIVLDIIEAPRSGSFAEIIRAHPAPEAADIDTEGLAILNGVRPDTPIAQGQLLKILVRRGG